MWVVYKFESCIHSERLLAKIEEFNAIYKKHGAETVDSDLVKHAIAVCVHYHKGQKRASGEPYYTHPIAVAELSMSHLFKTDIICGALLHDIIEDTCCTYEILEHNFGKRISEIVYGLTRKRNGVKISVQQIMQEALAANDKDVIIIKLFDRVHNNFTNGYLSPEAQKKMAIETLLHITPVSIIKEIYFVEKATFEICDKILNKDKIPTIDTLFYESVNNIDLLVFPEL